MSSFVLPRTARNLLVVMALLPLPALAQTVVPTSAAEVTLSFAPVVETAAPSVVSIYASRRVQVQSPFLDDPFFQHFFGNAVPREREQNALGSGVILDGGLVVSNFHVVEGADDIKVVLADRREFTGELLLSDEEADLAVIRLDGAGELPALALADSDAVAVGDLVLAIGNPFGVGQTVSSGIISGLARTGRGGGAFNGASYFIQTDAPINPGNSGGALVDMKGRLVGINTQIVTRSGGSNGIGFAIPAKLVAQVAAQAAAGESMFQRPWIGIDVQEVDAAIAEALGFDHPQGVLIRDVAAEGPFARAGAEAGDVLLSLGGYPVNAAAELKFRLSLQDMGSSVPVEVQRGGERVTFSVVMEPGNGVEALGAAPYEVTEDGPFKGLVVQEVTPDVVRALGLRTDTGVVIVGATATRVRNFQPGDVVEEVNGVAITGLDDFRAVLADGGRSWKILMNRRGGRVSLTWRG